MLEPIVYVGKMVVIMPWNILMALIFKGPREGREVSLQRHLAIVYLSTFADHLDYLTIKQFINPILRVFMRLTLWWMKCGEKEGFLRWVSREKGDGEVPLLLYIHGGGMCLDILTSHIQFMKLLAQEAGPMSVAFLDYSVCTPYPGPVEQAWDSYRAAVQTHKKIYLVGDSAGGTLCLNILQRCYTESEIFPEKCVLISPWLNVSKPELHLAENRPLDYLTWNQLALFKNIYAPSADPADPGVNIEVNFSEEMWGSILENTRCLLTYGDLEILKPQILRFYMKLQKIDKTRVLLARESYGVHVSTILFDTWNYPHDAPLLTEIIEFLRDV
ncbi:LAMI_0E06810g1_1 [Lachancea mirantina]|uniref:LAMI_0E06810g1_1 n=1 Tax=Lachancea mirantina TaxID=1230905 RepID=A0A1G4JM38_9SACH|nr:LAMI_0E06810g1_1 [Lachancea mirantina]